MPDSRTGKPLSAKHRAKIGAAMKGRLRGTALPPSPSLPPGIAVNMQLTASMEELAKLPRPQREAVLAGIARVIKNSR